MTDVLLVDDSMFMRLFYRRILEDHGIQIAGEAANGYEAIAQYQEYRPDIVILDINMPGISGIITLQELMRIDSSACIMMASAMGQEIFVQQSITFGAKAFIVKPISKRVLIKSIQHLVMQYPSRK